MSNGAGIQELMAAETRASQIVAEARIGEYLPLFHSNAHVIAKWLMLIDYL